MRLNPMEFAGQPPIDGYAPTGFRIAGRFHEGAVLIGPEGAGPWAVEQLDAADADPLAALAGSVDVLLLGVGATMRAAPAPLRRAVEAAGIGLEPMATPAACRTYNVMLAEGRRVAAALVPPGDA